MTNDDPAYRALDKRREAYRKWYHAHKEQAKAQWQKWYRKNRDKVLAKGREWKKNNRDKMREYNAKYVESHKEKVREARRKFHAKMMADPVLHAEFLAKRRVRETLRRRVRGVKPQPPTIASKIADTNLLACPFCGSSVSVSYSKHRQPNNKFVIKCPKCGIKMNGKYLDAVVAAWNRRATGDIV